MENSKLTAIATFMLAWFTFLATWGLMVHYSIQHFGFKGLELSFISEIYILFTLLFIRWIIGKIK